MFISQRWKIDARILLVSSRERRTGLMELLNTQGLELYLAAGVEEARQKLRTGIGFDLLFVDVELADGIWQDLVQHILDSEQFCAVVVHSRMFDVNLWGEVISSGAFDMISEPHDKSEILRVVESALKNRHTRNLARTRHPKVLVIPTISEAEPIARSA